jgi:hypothetical protein
MITEPKTIRNVFDKIMADPGILITPDDYRAMCDMRRLIDAGTPLTEAQTKYASGMIDRYAFGKRKRAK